MSACKGDTGEPGPEGPQGPPGEPGEPPDGGIGPEPLGLVGRVTESNGTLVGGTVYLVPASDVEAIAETEIDLFLSPEETAALDVDEPIEDLIDNNGDDYESAAVDDDGGYRFETLPDEGSFFVVWIPSDGDDTHLPGGDGSRVALDTAQLIGMELDIRVSSRPSASATYVGSSTCMGCHGLQSTTRTAHNVGLQAPGFRSILQDVEPWPDFDEGLTAFDNGTTLYFFDCDGMALDLSKCSVDVAPPAGAVAFTVDLRRDTGVPLGVVGAYYVEFVDGTTERYDVVLSYGGALERQQYLTRRTNPDGSLSYFVLPFQYNYQGDFSNPDPDDWPWRDYRSDLWYDLGSDALQQPGSSESFDNNCAGCHFTGYELRGSEADGWSARAVVDAGGAFDYDGDGRPELINTGCESCHGPGSEHLELSPQGSNIVSPSLITPGRHVMICGSCHSRPLGIGAGQTGLPLSAENQMPPSGLRRAEFAELHTTRVSGAREDFFESGDSLAHYQQYSDHIRSAHYRNTSRLTTCTGCHSPHANDADIAAMETSGNPNSLCTTCHSDLAEESDVNDHVAEVTGFGNHSGVTEISGPFLCTDCHMVPTAKSGASVRALFDSAGGPPAVQYFWNDIASHRMTVTRWTEFAGQPDQPIAFTNECGECHAEFLPNTPTP